MNKKSLIQIIVLVLLVVVGGGAYVVMTNDKGLDGLLEMVGLGASGDAPAAGTTPGKPSGMQRRDKPGAEGAAAAPSIPAHPAKGKYQGKDFTVAEATVESGTLILKPEGGAFEVRVVAPAADRWMLPAGKKISLVKASGAAAPRIEVVTLGPDGKVNEDRHTGQYTLLLEYGAIKDGKVNGKLFLELPAAAKLSVGGTFEARVSGFHFIDGKPDLSADSLDTLEYLALREILKDGSDQDLKNAVLRRRLSEAGSAPSGHVEASYTLGDAAPATRRFQFIKPKDVWQLKGELRLDQIDEAHPVKKPTAKDKPETVLAYLSAVRLEKDLNTRFKKKGIFVDGYSTRYNLKSKLGQCEVTYRVEGNEKPLTVAYLFALKGNGWALTRQLGDKERLDAANVRVEKRK